MKKHITLWLCLCFIWSWAFVQDKEKKQYHPVGLVANPKVNVHWNVYHDYAKMTEIMKALQKAYPKYCKLESIGKSYGGKDLWVMTVTDFSVGPVEERSAYWMDGGIHANELQAPEVVLYSMWYLLEMADHNKAIKKLLKERVFYGLPMFSPDSRDSHMYLANTTHTPRSGQRPVDDDLDGLYDEDGFDDLDGDGHIVMMRQKDPRGSFRLDLKNPQKLIRVKEGEQGEYRLLGYEGIDNDGDGRVNEDGAGYYDPNRNFAWSWKADYIQKGSGNYPFANKENRAVVDYILKRPHISGLQTYHNTGGMLLIGPGDKTKLYEASDNRLYEALSKKGEEMLPGYKHKVIYKDLYPAYGTEVDWAYNMLGAIAYNNELFTSYNFFHKEAKGWVAKPDVMHQFNRDLLFDDGWVKWKEFDHPQYGKIEVGGFKKNWSRQAPGFMLQEECHRNMAFTFYQANQMPQVDIFDSQVKKLGENRYEVTVTVINQKMQPTHLAIDLKHKLTRPNVLSIMGGELKVIYGLLSTNPYFKSPEEQKYKPENMKINNIPGKGTLYVRWLLEGQGQVRLDLSSIKGGRVEKVIELK